VTINRQSPSPPVAEQRPFEPAPSRSTPESVWLIGAALIGAILAFLVARQVLNEPPMSDWVSTLLWYAVRVAGIGAYLMLWLTTVAGICISGKFSARWLPGGLLFPLHQLADFALLLAALHASLLLGDRFAGFTPTSLVVPFQASYRPLWTGFGILALYLMAFLYWSVEFRPRIGYRAWRLIHYASFATFGLAMVHGLASGTDSGSVPMHLMYFLTSFSAVVLTYWRWRATRSR